MKLFLFFATLVFLFQGYILDATQRAYKKDIIYGLGSGKVDRLAKAISLYNDGYASTGKVFFSARKRVFNWKINHDVRYIRYKSFQDKIILIKNAKNTMEEILAIEKIMLENNYTSAIIVTDPPHSRRVQIFIELFTKQLKKDYVIVSSNPAWWNKYLYFTNWYAFKFVMSELVKTPYDLIKYGFFYKYIKCSDE